MTTTPKALSLLILTGILAMPVTASAEIQTAKQTTAPSAEGSIASIECWQNAVKVVAERNLKNLTVSRTLPQSTVGPSLEGGSIGIKARKNDESTLHLVALGESLCLIREKL